MSQHALLQLSKQWLRDGQIEAPEIREESARRRAARALYLGVLAHVCALVDMDITEGLRVHTHAIDTLLLRLPRDAAYAMLHDAFHQVRHARNVADYDIAGVFTEHDYEQVLQDALTVADILHRLPPVPQQDPLLGPAPPPGIRDMTPWLWRMLMHTMNYGDDVFGFRDIDELIFPKNVEDWLSAMGLKEWPFPYCEPHYDAIWKRSIQAALSRRVWALNEANWIWSSMVDKTADPQKELLGFGQHAGMTYLDYTVAIKEIPYYIYTTDEIHLHYSLFICPEAGHAFWPSDFPEYTLDGKNVFNSSKEWSRRKKRLLKEKRFVFKNALKEQALPPWVQKLAFDPAWRRQMSIADFIAWDFYQEHTLEQDMRDVSDAAYRDMVLRALDRIDHWFEGVELCWWETQYTTENPYEEIAEKGFTHVISTSKAVQMWKAAMVHYLETNQEDMLIERRNHGPYLFMMEAHVSTFDHYDAFLLNDL